jgi:hypothetical protein
MYYANFAVPAEKIRVGRDYQVIVPELVPVNGKVIIFRITMFKQAICILLFFRA